jgi:hypothetical protein
MILLRSLVRGVRTGYFDFREPLFKGDTYIGVLDSPHWDPPFSDWFSNRVSQGESTGITKGENWFENRIDGSHPSENRTK